MCMSVPAKNRSGTFTDSHAEVMSGYFPLGTISGRQEAANGVASKLKPVQWITRSTRIERRSIRVDRVIHCTGFSFDATPFAASCRPEIVPSGKYPDMTSAWESVNVPDLFFAGTLMHMRDYRRSFSGFI